MIKYLGKAYEIANVFPGDIIIIKNSIVYGGYEYEVIDPIKYIHEYKTYTDKYVYFKLGLFIDGMPPVRVMKINKLKNSCIECNIEGEYINGAFKCPKCWKIWY